MIKSPQQRADKTRETILAAARKLFVEYGFEGTSIGLIAKLAKVNHSLIFHHFGNKHRLWSAVKMSIVEENNAKRILMPPADQPLRNFLTKLIKSSVSFYQDNPDIMRMIGWQRLEQKESKKFAATFSKQAAIWIDAFKAYQTKGEINPKLPPEFIVTMILSILSSAVGDPMVFIKDPKKFRAYLRFCVDRLMVMLKP